MASACRRLIVLSLICLDVDMALADSSFDDFPLACTWHSPSSHRAFSTTKLPWQSAFVHSSNSRFFPLPLASSLALTLPLPLLLLVLMLLLLLLLWLWLALLLLWLWPLLLPLPLPLAAGASISKSSSSSNGSSILWPSDTASSASALSLPYALRGGRFTYLSVCVQSVGRKIEKFH